jgi:hypothetical protein
MTSRDRTSQEICTDADRSARAFRAHVGTTFGHDRTTHDHVGTTFGRDTTTHAHVGTRSGRGSTTHAHVGTSLVRARWFGDSA